MKTIYNTLMGLLILGSLTGCKKESSADHTAATEEILATKTSISEIKTEEVQYYAKDSTLLKGYFAYPAGQDIKSPGILVVHEWWGLNDYARERARQLAEKGYAALAIDMYGDGKQAMHPDDAGKFAGMVMQNIDIAKMRFEAGMDYLKSRPETMTDKMAAIGYCFGGSVVLSMADAGYDLDAAAAFHSGVQLPVMPSEQLKARVLVANGAADPFISTESVERYKAMMDSVGARYQYINFEGVQHSFTSKAADSLGKKFNLPLAYDAEADRRSWEALMNLLQESFK